MRTTEPGRCDGDDSGHRLGRRLANLIRQATRRFATDRTCLAAEAPVAASLAPEDAPLPDLLSTGCATNRTNVTALDFRWRRHPQLRQDSAEAVPVDPRDRERGARSAAVRGLFLARSGRFDDARASFAVAAGEPSIDLTAIPGFWDLPRGGMTAAADAYEDVERFRDAAALEARIRLTYRPRPVAGTRGSSR